MEKDSIKERSAMQVALITRLVGVTITIFILTLTLKSELLNYKTITWQLVLAIPLLFAALLTNSKITDIVSFKEHRKFNLIVNSASIALIFNTIGLLVTKYVSIVIGITYFILFIAIYGYFLIKDWDKGKFYNELIIIALLILFGLIPALIIQG